MPNTNVTGLPRTGLVDTNVIRTTKSAVQSIALNPILLPFRKLDGSFERDLTMPFSKGAMVNVQVAPVLTAQETSDLSTYNANFQQGDFTQVAVKLDYVHTVGWKRTQVQEAVSDVDEATIRGYQAGNALVKKMYRKVITSVVNDSLIASDQRIGTAGTALNYKAFTRVRTLAESMFGIDRSIMMRMIVNPFAYEALSNDDKFINNDYMGANGEVMMTSLISKTQNIEIFSDYNFSLTGGSSVSVSGSAGAIGVAFVDESFVMPIRRLGVMDPTRQYEATVDGIPLLATLDNDISSAPGLVQNNKFDILWGIKNLPAIREDNSTTSTKVFPILGGVA